MGAAAELDRVMPSFDDANDLAVLLAEKGNGPGTFRLFPRRLESVHRLVPEHLVVYEVLHTGDLLLGHRPEVAEVEAQPVRGDERALLADVVTEHLAQGPVQKVGAGVVSPYRLPPLPVDGGKSLLTGLDVTVDEVAEMTVRPSTTEVVLEHSHRPVGVVMRPVSPTWPPPSA